MYVVAMKNRPNELSAMKLLQDNNLLLPNVIPLIEVIKEKYECDKLMDPDTGKPVRREQRCKNGKIRNCGVDNPDTRHDVTLRKITECFPGRDVLVDYFRCDLKKYHYDPVKIELILKLNNDLDLYCEKVLKILDYPHLIPVITVKRGMDYVLSPEGVIKLADELRQRNPDQRIALRIDDMEGYEDAATEVLRADDLLIFDFNEQPIKSKPIECKRLKGLNLPAHLVALCSPRQRGLSGKDFQDCIPGEVTKLIDNSHLDIFYQYGFDGIGDYGGLRDNLPDKGINKGRALAVMYDGRVNGFRIYIKDDYELGPKGYWEVVDRLIGDPAFDQDGSCLAFVAIMDKYRKRDKDYTFAEWIKYTLIRYIQQLSINRPELVQ